MTIYPFGTNGFFASFGRETACYAIPYDDTLIVLDAGTGLFRFVEKQGQTLLKKAKTIHLYLSHHHLDHTMGLWAAFQIFQHHDVHIFGITQEKFIQEFCSRDSFPTLFTQNYVANWQWHTVEEGTSSRNGYSVSVRKQYHNGFGSFAYRFDFGIAYVTDSEPTEASVNFLKGTSVLLHEHYFSGREKLVKGTDKLEDHFEGGHTTTVGAALVAKKAGVEKLMLIHHNPFFHGHDLYRASRAADHIFSPALLAHDGMLIYR